MALRTRHGEGSTVPQDTAMDSTHTASPCHAGCLSWHCRATCWDISLATRCCHVWNCFTEPPSLAGEKLEQRVQPLAAGPTLGTGSTTQEPFPMWMSPSRAHRAGASPLQPSTATELWILCMAQHGTAHLPLPKAPGAQDRDGTVGTVLLETPNGPIPIPGCWSRGENAKSPHFFEVAPRRRGQGGKQFAAKSLHLICATFRQPHQLWMAGKQARCALRPARPEPTLTPNGAPVTIATRANSRKDF